MLARLISLPSISSASPEWDHSNEGVVRLLAEWLEPLGFTVEIMEVPGMPGKFNLIATLGSGPGGLVLSGHTDTVPFDDKRWQSDPFSLTEKNNRWYGLGTCRSEEHTSELQSRENLVCRLLLERVCGPLALRSFPTRRSSDLEIMEVPGMPGKFNLIATLGSGPGGLVLSGHTDTVPFDDKRWQSDPFSLTEKNNRWYGLGTC